MAIVKVHNKSRGVTYVYESHSYWDKDLKQPRSNRKLIGKIDPATGEVIPTGKKGRQKQEPSSEKKTVHSATESMPSSDQSARLLKEKDAEILRLKQQIGALEKELSDCRRFIQQAYALLGKAVSEGR